MCARGKIKPDMKPENATDDNLEEYLKTDGIVIIDF